MSLMNSLTVSKERTPLNTYICRLIADIINFINTEKKVENTTRGGVFLTNFEVIGNVAIVLTVCYIFSIETKTKEKTRFEHLGIRLQA